jgi:hypothetical protein
METNHEEKPTTNHQDATEQDHLNQTDTSQSSKPTSRQNTSMSKQASMEKRSSRPVSPIHIPNSARRDSVRSGGGVSFSHRKGGHNTNRSNTNLSTIRTRDPYLTTINDMKYIGDQVVVGKFDPNLKSNFEEKFQKRFTGKLQKSQSSLATSRSLDIENSLKEFKRTKDIKTLADPNFLANELKFTGDQFKVGKLDPKMQTPFERKFQKQFEKRLKILAGDSSSDDTKKQPIKFEDLKEMHNALSVEHTSYRVKK